MPPLRDIITSPEMLAWLRAHPAESYDRKALSRTQAGTLQFYEHAWIKMQLDSRGLWAPGKEELNPDKYDTQLWQDLQFALSYKRKED